MDIHLLNNMLIIFVIIISMILKYLDKKLLVNNQNTADKDKIDPKLKKSSRAH